ncbi:MAG: hypothetical protein HOC09_11095 [Deltaproteobacteria bacterium]|jgi:hypothetical protein|nr:hypothetical protein [Deltaproteobacteria bacterium]MBT4639359.1 hypothetical protein [Deltaproteobacteria bacterium]
MLSRKNAPLIFLIPAIWLLFVLIPGTTASQTVSPHDVSSEIEKIIDRIQTAMNSSDEQIEQGNYDQAQDGTETSIDSLSILLDLFMPLTERIKLIWEKEKEIVTQTEGLSKETVRVGKAPSAKIENLVTAQQENMGRTQKAEDAIVQQLKGNPDSQNLNNGSRQPSPQGGDQSQIDLLNRVGGLLKEAKVHQGAAVDFLSGDELKTALQSEIMAEKKLKEALDAFQNQQQQNNRQQQQQQKQPSQNGDENRPQDRKQGSQKDSQEPNQDPGRPEAKSDTTPNSEKKLTPKEALKELYRLRKEADAEKKRREKASGKQAVPGRAPIEKDW